MYVILISVKTYNLGRPYEFSDEGRGLVDMSSAELEPRPIAGSRGGALSGVQERSP